MTGNRTIMAVFATPGRLIIAALMLCLIITTTLSGQARADTATTGNAQVTASIQHDLLARAQRGPRSAPHSLAVAPQAPPGIHPMTTNRGAHTTSVAVTVSGVTTLSGNAHGMKRGNYTLVGTIYVNNALSGGAGPLAIINNTNGQLPDSVACYIPGSVITYVVGLLNANATQIIDVASATTKA